MWKDEGVAYRDATTGRLVFWTANGPNQRRPPEFVPASLLEDSSDANLLVSNEQREADCREARALAGCL